MCFDVAYCITWTRTKKQKIVIGDVGAFLTFLTIKKILCIWFHYFKTNLFVELISS